MKVDKMGMVEKGADSFSSSQTTYQLDRQVNSAEVIKRTTVITMTTLTTLTDPTTLTTLTNFDNF